MSLKELRLKASYDSTEDDLLKDFYIPALSHSVKYSRIAGFFSSTALAVAAKGISFFVHNGGSMKIIAGARLTEKDIQEILRGKEIIDVISQAFIDDVDSLENQLIQDHVKALGWMLRNNKLELRVAVPVDFDGKAMDEQSVIQRGIFHQKVGILEDGNGNIISFSGSVNETAMAWVHNIEEFKVFKNWIDGEVDHLNADLNKFARFWNGGVKHMIVLDIPTAVKNKLVSIAPDDFEKLFRGSVDDPSKIKLRDYQEKAVAEWSKVGKGMIEMATGTGKTFVALACLEKTYNIEKKLAVVISCPFIHLINQWQDNLNKWNYASFLAFGSFRSWIDELANKIHDLNNGYRKLMIIVTTHDTFSTDKFTALINGIQCPILLIADEVHGLGSLKRRKGLLEKYNYRIGLSATPQRWFDEEGSNFIANFFGNTVFELGLKEAIPAYLSPYDYFLNIIELQPEELEEYLKYSKKIAKEYFIGKNLEENEGLKMLLIKRQKIINNAQNKMSTFIQILKSMDEIQNCLVYCAPEQIDLVQDILNNLKIIHHKFTAKEDFKERKDILNSFGEGIYQALVAMKCLDEGVDVPGTKIAIILASSTNPREFIQRRGRILRKHPNKNKSVIYDFFVVPSMKPNFDEIIFEIEGRIIKKELKRIMEFASCAMNYVESLNKIYPIVTSYKINLEELGI